VTAAVPEADAGDEDQSPGLKGAMNSDLKSFRSSRGSKASANFQPKKSSTDVDKIKNVTIDTNKSFKNAD
jgi:hypothetical protein